MAQKKLKVEIVSAEDRQNLDIFTVDCLKNGVELGRSKLLSTEDPREHLSLAIPDFSKKLSLRQRHALSSAESFKDFEQKLQLAFLKGELEHSCVFLGVQTDPFYPFEGKFDVTIKLLKLFEKYKPARLVIQTRSPLIVIAIASLKALADRISVTMVLETCIDNVAARYTPEFPKVSERIKAITALKRFRIPVDIQVAPLLPYGRKIEDAGRFADILVGYADHVYIKPLCSEGSSEEKNAMSDLIIGSLAANHGTEWLQPESADALIAAVKRRGAEKLLARPLQTGANKQLAMF
jgi:hypothetical protein